MAASGAGIDLSVAARLGAAFQHSKAAIVIPINRLYGRNVFGW